MAEGDGSLRHTEGGAEACQRMPGQRVEARENPAGQNPSTEMVYKTDILQVKPIWERLLDSGVRSWRCSLDGIYKKRQSKALSLKR